jgi:transposase
MKAKYWPCRCVQGAAFWFAFDMVEMVNLRALRRQQKTLPMNIRYRVTLSDEERTQLQALLNGKAQVRQVKRAQILLAAEQGTPEHVIAKAVRTSEATIYRTKKNFVEQGLEVALHEAQRPGARRKLTGKEEALLIATACSTPPPGQAHWTLDLLADELIQLTEHDSLSRTTVGRRLKENKLKPWQEKMWCVPKVDSEYVVRMEDVLDLYAEPHDPERPVLCFDESPTQLIDHAHPPEPVAPGTPARVDYEYVRNGTANLFVAYDIHAGWRHVDVTQHRTSRDFAHQIKALVDEHYPQAKQIRVVLDNLSTHKAAALYDTFPPAEARRILKKLEFHYVPKHASWLNMVEIEIGVLKQQCLSRRISDLPTLVREINAWQERRNNAGDRIRWMFTTERAREKLTRVYRPIAQALERAAPETPA